MSLPCAELGRHAQPCCALSPRTVQCTHIATTYQPLLSYSSHRSCTTEDASKWWENRVVSTRAC